MSINTQAALDAVRTHGTVFFDANLQPVVPTPGQWFCEFYDAHGAPMLRHLVSAEHADDARRPQGLVLVLQH